MDRVILLALGLFIGLAIGVGIGYIITNISVSSLQSQVSALNSQLVSVQSLYDNMTSNYQGLQNQYNSLHFNYSELNAQYQTVSLISEIFSNNQLQPSVFGAPFIYSVTVDGNTHSVTNIVLQNKGIHPIMLDFVMLIVGNQPSWIIGAPPPLQVVSYQGVIQLSPGSSYSLNVTLQAGASGPVTVKAVTADGRWSTFYTTLDMNKSATYTAS